MKLRVEIELGNDAMQTPGDVLRALNVYLGIRDQTSPLEAGEDGAVGDVNGNTVGHWEVTDDG